jgi:two-component system CheB/CheR fusion protein
VAAGEAPIERRVERPEIGSSYLVRIGPYRNEAGEIEGVVITFTNVTGLTRAEERQRILIAELQHRTRNLLAVVHSIAAQTLGKGGTLDAFGDRLAALGRVQSSISRSADEDVDLGDLIRSELEAHGSQIGRKVTISGPTVALRGEQVQTFALALHELATNALKHGALKPETLKESRTHLDISWTVENKSDLGPLLALVWRESGVTMPTESSQKGYGRRLIEEVLAYSLHAKTALVFGADGVVYTIEIPLDGESTGSPGKAG